MSISSHVFQQNMSFPHLLSQDNLTCQNLEVASLPAVKVHALMGEMRPGHPCYLVAAEEGRKATRLS